MAPLISLQVFRKFAAEVPDARRDKNAKHFASDVLIFTGKGIRMSWMFPIGSTEDDFMPYLKYFKPQPVGIGGRTVWSVSHSKPKSKGNKIRNATLS